MLTSKTIESQFEEMRQYQRINFGLKNGEDFPDIARALAECKEFESLSMAASALSALVLMTIPKTAGTTEQMQEELRDSPMKHMMADIFYCGYRIGRQQFEREQQELERIKNASQSSE